MTDFIKVADLADIREGQLLPLEVEGELICLALLEGVIYAFYDNCTHISAPLSRGERVGCIVTCPWHGAQFDISTGKVLRGPARQDLPVYPVRVMDNAIYIQMP